MLDRFLEFIKKHALIEESDRLLLAVSGGVDSMVLLHLFSQADYRFSVAHCNFQLRGEQADLDEELVESAAEELDVPFHSIRFETKEYAHNNGISTQMAARDLRFEWFHQLCEEFGYNKIVLAHHRDDSIETFFLNLTRGTSLRGLRGIQAQNDRLIRPLLPFSKEELLSYAHDNGVVWREDASNQENYYKRNLIRHELLPVLKKLNPDFEKVMTENLEKLEYSFQTSQKQYDQIFSEAITIDGDKFLAKIQTLTESCENPYDLYEVLRNFSVNYDTAKSLYRAIHECAVGKIFKSEKYDLLLDREALIITTNNSSTLKNEITIVDSDDELLEVGEKRYHVSILNSSDWHLDKDPINGAFDFDKLQFPLTIRPWQEGDSFQPLGMQGSKLVSDLLIDLKVPLTEKTRVTVLLSNEEIVWVMGYRISEKFKVTSSTTKVWELKPIKTSH